MHEIIIIQCYSLYNTAHNMAFKNSKKNFEKKKRSLSLKKNAIVNTVPVET